ncbi:MAG: hypothetical protein RMI51_04150 [Aquificaceae bacterium]|nr:hypothetical protein [Aquificaceae bacterium]
MLIFLYQKKKIVENSGIKEGLRLVFSVHLATGEDNGDAHLKNLLNHL